jgi:hypothetical protein
VARRERGKLKPKLRQSFRRKNFLSSPPGRTEGLPTEINAIDVHCIFLAFNRLALQLSLLSGVTRNFVLVCNLVNFALIVDQDNVSGFVSTGLVTGRVAGILCDTFGIA